MHSRVGEAPRDGDETAREREDGHPPETAEDPERGRPHRREEGEEEGKERERPDRNAPLSRDPSAGAASREAGDRVGDPASADEDAEETRRIIEQDEGGRCLLIKGDVTDPAFCRDAVEQTVEELGGLDVLVSNAAFQEHTEDIDDLTEEHFDLTFKTNVYGTFYLTKAALKHMKQGSSILITSSETGIFGEPSLLDYSSTKGALNAFTMALATNLADRGIRVNAVTPGPTWTPLNPADRPAEKVKEFGKSTAFRRPAQPEEVAPAYVFLASPVTGSYITGLVLPVIGGVVGAMTSQPE